MLHSVSQYNNIMENDDGFDTLSTVLAEYDARGWPVRHVEATRDGPEGADGGALSVALEVPVRVPPDDGTGPPVTPTRATVTEDDDLRVDYRLPDDPVPGADHPAVAVRDCSVRLDDDGTPLLVVEMGVRPSGGDGASADADRCRDVAGPTDADGGVEAGVETERDRGTDADGEETAPDGDGSSPDPERATALSALRDESVPPYEDVAYLRRLYEACDTFGEMSRLIEMDVAAETVRRYMIDAGIHDPDSYDTAHDDPSTDGGDGATEVELVADGIGLPEDVDREELVEAVVDAKTVYEVRRHLGLDGARTRELLREFDLLDLVCGRIDADPASETTREDVAVRLRRAAGGQTPEASAGR